MTMKNIISASILSADFACLQNQITACEKAGVDWIHVDVMDGHFVPNLTMGPFIVAACRRITNLPLDCHLMVDHPETLINAFAKAGASNLTIHPENNPSVEDTLIAIRALGCKPGIAINPLTPVEEILPLMHLVDMVLVMTVNPGYSGQEFKPEVIQKISQVSAIINETNPSIRLEVDGGINVQTVQSVLSAGANTFVSASAIFGDSDGISAGVSKLRAFMN